MRFFKIIEKFFSSFFVAGDTAEDALRVAAKLNKEGVEAIINFLGEEVINRKQAEENVKVYAKIFIGINDRKLQARISVKPTQLGLKIDKYFYRFNLVDLVNIAIRYRIPLEIDMEGRETVDETIALTKELKNYSDKLDLRQSVALNFRDSLKWVHDLTACKCKIRLCKGAYSGDCAREPLIKKRFISALLFLLNSGADPDIATHDIGLLREIYSLPEMRLNRYSCGFQFLLGFRRRTIRYLVEDDERVAVYVPFGPNRLPYAKRRWKYLIKNLPSIFLG